jgi:hypothetical protein
MRLLLLISILTLGACTSEPKATLPTAWARADDQPVGSGLLDIDKLDCRDQIQKSDGAANGRASKDDNTGAMVDDFVSCMKQRGYVQIKN